MRLVLLFLLLCTACFPTARALNAQRSGVWAPPHATTVFSWVSIVEHRETRVLELGKEDAKVESDTSDDTVRTTIYAIDPQTRQETRLGQLPGDGGTPIYYDAPRDILWVRGEERELFGFTRSGKPVRGPHHQRQLEVPALEPPFVLASSPTGVISLYDLRRDASIVMPLGADKADIVVSGDLLRFTEIAAAGESMRVFQIAIDWSSGAPQRLPDIDWSTAPLSPTVGVRLAHGMLRDGLRYAEVVRGPDTATRLLVFDIVAGGAPPIQIPLPVDYVTESPSLANATLVAFGGDALAFVETAAQGEKQCLRGATVRVDAKLVVPLPADRCVLGARPVGPHRVLQVESVGTAVVGPDARLVPLDIDAGDLAKGIVTGPTTRAVTDATGKLEEIDLATGARRQLAQGDRADRLLGVDDNVARYARGTDKLVTFPLGGNGTPRVISLGEPKLARGDRMPIDRTEFWLGVNGGATTRGNGAGGLNAEVAHWIRDRWTWVVRASFRGEAEADNEDQSYFDAGASFGFAWHRLPRLFSLSFEADVGANYSATYLEKTRTDAAFAPSAELHLGWQGKMLGIDVSAVVPSFIEIDRGVLFMLNAKIGFTENLR